MSIFIQCMQLAYTKKYSSELICILAPYITSTMESLVYLELWSIDIKQTLVVIHPCLSHACCVETMGVLIAWEGVWMEGTEYVAHARTWNGL